MGPSVHRDLGHDRIAEVAPVEERLQRPHRLVVAHVLVDGEGDARLVAEADDFRRVGQIRRQRFLGQDALDVIGVLHRLPDDAELLVRRVGDVDDLDVRVGEQIAPVIVDTLDAAQLGGGARILWSTGGDSDDVEPGFLIGREMDVAHDEPGADHPDPIVGLRP